MQIQFILRRVHQRGMFSARAYEILFTDEHIYFLHLGEDSSVMPFGSAMGGLAGAIGQSIADKLSERSIARRLHEIRDGDLDAAVAKDRRSIKAAYSEIERFDSKPYKWNQWPQVTFRIRGKGKRRFVFNLQEPDYESERQAVVAFMDQKRPGLVPSSSS